MNWITIIWTAIASAMIAIAGVYLVVWLQQRETRSYLMFVLLAISTAGIAGTELWMMKSMATSEFGTAGQWFHLPVGTAIIAFVGLAYYRLDSNYLWLGLTACGLRVVAVTINFLQDPNINYSEITRLDRIVLLGESISLVDGVPNPWMLVAQLSLLTLIVYIALAAVSAWRRERDPFTLAMGIAFCSLVIGGSLQAVLGFWEVLQIPVVLTPFFLGVSVVMAVDLSREILRARQLDLALSTSNTELRDSEQRLTLAAEAANAGLWSLDSDTRHIWATRKARDFFVQDSTREIHWQDLLDRVHPDDQSHIRKEVDIAQASGELDLVEFRVVGLDGGIRWLGILGSWRSGGAADAGKLTGVVMDITDRKMMERDAAQQKSQLAHLSRAAALNELSASLAHEINQPLGIILSNAEAAQMLLGKRSPDIGEIREIMDDIISADRRAAGVISGLRSLLHQQEPEFRAIALSDAINDASKLLRGELNIHDVSMDLDLGDDIPPVRADPILLVQVLLNLLTNACDAVAENPRGNRKIKVATRSDNQFVLATISDNGAGLPQDPDQVFDPYFTTKSSGLGMGLAITQSIVTSHDGRLWADSNDAGETTFYLSLPHAMEAI